MSFQNRPSRFTIFWLATGTGVSGTSGIGSRFFTVSNVSEVVDPSTAPSVQTSVPSARAIASRSTLDMPAAAASRIVSGQMLAVEIGIVSRKHIRLLIALMD